MEDHKCLHTEDFNQIIADRVQWRNDISTIKDSQERLEKRFGRIDKTVFGNGEEGHITKLARHGDAIKRMWWAVGIIIMGLSGLAIRSLM